MTSLLCLQQSAGNGTARLDVHAAPSGPYPDNTSGMIDWYRQNPAVMGPKEGATVPGTPLNTSTTHPKRSLVHFWNIKLLSTNAWCTRPEKGILPMEGTF